VKSLIRYYVQFRGWKTKRRIVVIESDDWGSIRMPDKKTFDILSKKNPKILRDPYCKFDMLESKADIDALSNVLTRFKDFSGKPPVITVNTIVGNPCFDKIKESRFESYFFEEFDKTYQRFSDGNRTLDALYSAINEGLLFPQLHGREHVHVPLWLNELRSGQPELLHAFEHNCFGVPYSSSSSNNLRKNLLASLDRTGVESEHTFQENSIQDGAHIFEKQFGFRSVSFIAPAYTWQRSIEKKLSEVGVISLQGLPLQYEASKDKNAYNKLLHFTGQRNKLGQHYTVRNVFFEPSTNINFDWFGSAIERVGEAFFFNKPAIISMHRLNFIGGIDHDQRNRNLILLANFFSALLKKWPTIEFITSQQLANVISNESSST
jgi:hypothetical protein